MKKLNRKVIALCFIALLVVGMFPISAFAAIQESEYINSYSVGLSQGSSNGQLKLSYNIIGTGTMDTIGITKIVVYKSNGAKYKTIYGSLTNGLLEQNTFSAFGVYSISVTAGNSYICQVTFYSAKNGGYDTRTVFTNTVALP